MNIAEALEKIPHYPHVVLVFKDANGYPMSVATTCSVDAGRVILHPARTGFGSVRDIDECQLVCSHIRPYPGVGYDQRRYIELTGSLQTSNGQSLNPADRSLSPADRSLNPAGRWVFTPARARGWDEDSIPFFELAERALPQARRYMAQLSAERGTPVEPTMSAGWKLFLATRAPFLTATLVPVFLGVAAAAYEHHFSLWLMLLTLVGAIAVHLGLNIANDVFDARSGADTVNVTPTMFSGGSRVIQYGLVSSRQMVLLCGAFYTVGIVIGLLLVALTGVGLLWVGVAGIVISWFYTAPPVRLVHRGLGEVATALGFGPIMVLGAYFVQTGHYSWKPAVLSIPVAILVMLILYANEIPDRIPDTRAGKRTLVVRMSPRAVVTGYVLAAAIAYLTLIVGVIVGLVPWPALIGLLTIPLAYQVAIGLRQNYDRPYEVMPFLQKNILLHLSTGVLLIAGTFAGLLTI